MDLQTRKLNAISYLIKLQDETILRKIESTIIDSRNREKKHLKPFTKKQLLDRAKQSNMDYQAGNVKTQNQLEIESENW
jgi:hypothetical protein